MTDNPLPHFDQFDTARLLPYGQLVKTLKATMLDYADGHIASPERLVVPLQDGAVMLSMPATASDLAMHKLVNVCPKNGPRGLPTIHGHVTAYDANTGVQLFMLDGPTVTGRRTAAVTLLAIETILGHPPKHILLIGTGKQAVHHVEALSAFYPAAHIIVQASTAQKAYALCVGQTALSASIVPMTDAIVPASIDVVIAATTSKTPIYSLPASEGRLVIGVGAFTPDAAEIAADTVLNSVLFVDDVAGAIHEAGDLIQAGVEWEDVRALSSLMRPGNDEHFAKPVLFKSVGCAPWDLAPCRVVRDALFQ
jgi:1-piperideine-2-carboxylate/1-pyrroline-2-carboxylate reductase [NAD(P)H]